MKIKGFFSIILFSFLFSFSCAQENNITIQGKFEGEKIPTSISYSIAVNGTSFSHFKKKTPVDENGNFEFTLALKEASFLNLEYEANHLRPVKFENKTYKTDLLKISNRYFIVEPNIKHYDITIQIAEQGSRLLVNNDNQMAQRFVNFLNYYPPTSLFASNHFEENVIDIEDLMAKIENTKQKELKPLQELLESNNISQAFYDVVKADRDSYYSIIQATTSANMLKKMPKCNKKILANWENSFASIKSNHAGLFKGIYFYTYLKQYVRYNILKNFNFNSTVSKQTLKPLHASNQFDTYFINEAKKVLNRKQLEFFTASYIHEVLRQEGKENDAFQIYTDFSKDFPNSSYISIISKEIETLIANNVIRKDQNPENTKG